MVVEIDGYLCIFMGNMVNGDLDGPWDYPGIPGVGTRFRLNHHVKYSYGTARTLQDNL